MIKIDHHTNPPGVAAGVPAVDVLPALAAIAQVDSTIDRAESTVESQQIRAAHRIAAKTLRENTWTPRVGHETETRPVLLAGQGKFDSLWGRDALFASLGAVAVGDTAVVKGTLQALLDYQFEDGVFPRRIGHGAVWVQSLRHLLGFERPRPERFDTIERLGAHKQVTMDTNLLVPIVFEEYVRQTGDQDFARAYLPHVERGLAWLRSQMNADGLLVQDPMGDWKDLVDRGRVLMYNQALYYQALRSTASVLSATGEAERADSLRAEADAVAQRARRYFWDADGKYFRDSETSSAFSPDGNLFAVAFGLATPEEAQHILHRSQALLSQRGLLPALDGHYPSGKVPWVVKLQGIRHYHDDFAWPWLTSLYAVAAARHGDVRGATSALTAVADAAARDGGFFEVYDGEPLRPVDTFLYDSEPDFSWSSGLYLWASDEVRKASQRQQRISPAISPRPPVDAR